MIEEWNEYDELREALGFTGAPAKPVLPTKTAATATASATAAKPDVKKENAPLPSSEQNLAIRQLGAEAAKVAAAKKPTPTKIATTNPLLTEKVNSPAVSTPKSASAEKASPSALLSPRNIPLPATPSAETSSRPSLIKSPSSTSSGSHRSFHGADVEDMPEDEIRKIEQEEAIPEVSSSEEEDSEDEEERRKSVSSLAGSKKEPLTDSAPAAKAKDTKAPEGKDAKGTEGKETRTAAAESSEEESDEDEEDEDEDEESEDDEEEQPQKQPAKAAAKAGSSVKD